jgi:hypothetical protein
MSHCLLATPSVGLERILGKVQEARFGDDLFYPRVSASSAVL